MDDWTGLPGEVGGRLFAARTVLVSGPLTLERVAQVSAQMTALASDSALPITINLSVPDGDVEAALGLHDLIQFVAARVLIVASGRVAGAGVLVYAAPPREDRFALPNARFGLLEPTFDRRSPHADIQREAEEARRLRDRIAYLLVEATDQPFDRIKADLRQQTWLDAEAAVAYGLAGRVVQHSGEVR